MSAGPDLSLDAVVRHVVRQELREELDRALAPLLERLDALAAAAPPALVDVATAAERLGKSEATVRAMCASGALKAIRVGAAPEKGAKDRRSWRIDLASLRPVSDEEIARMAAESGR